MVGFVHLHTRSGFSYGYGTAIPEELVEATGEMRVGSMALTDRDGLYGIPRFLRAAAEQGISPIVGDEVSVEGGGHLVLLAESMRGYRSLSKLITSYRCSSEERRKPRCPFTTLLEHAEDLICLTGATPSGLLAYLVLSGQVSMRSKVLRDLLEVFGAESLFVELTDDQAAGSRRRLRRVALLARQYGLRVGPLGSCCMPVSGIPRDTTYRFFSWEGS